MGGKGEKLPSPRVQTSLPPLVRTVRRVRPNVCDPLPPPSLAPATWRGARGRREPGESDLTKRGGPHTYPYAGESVISPPGLRTLFRNQRAGFRKILLTDLPVNKLSTSPLSIAIL
ncbi:hypothetical protein NL676_005661 [Syzygium grande]|nr:hypothetical protein NL676_005661 [Syzygium grande]